MGMAYNSSKVARRTSQAVSQREKKLKAVEKKHARRASQAVYKKQVVKVAEKKHDKTQHATHGEKRKCRSQARKNQSEEKFRKTYGEDDYHHDGELEEEPVQVSTAEDLEDDMNSSEFLYRVESRLEDLSPGLAESLGGRARLVEELERRALVAARVYWRSQAAALYWCSREEEHTRKRIAEVLDSYLTEILIESLSEEDR
jgi:hypothetical protein